MTRNGAWDTKGSCTFTYEQTPNLKEYEISQDSYPTIGGTTGTMPVVSAVKGTRGNDRFYVIALKDFTVETTNEDNITTTHTRFCWYGAGNITDSAVVSKTGFGTGETNTKTMISKWNGSEYAEEGFGDYGKQNACSNLDMWGVIQEKVKDGWFIPSKDEWSAFGYFLNNKTTNALNATNLGLWGYYWSSSIYNCRNRLCRYGVAEQV